MKNAEKAVIVLGKDVKMTGKTKDAAKVLKDMYQYKDYEAFARQMIELAMDNVVAKRTHIQLPDEEEYANYVVEVLQDINDELKVSAELAE